MIKLSDRVHVAGNASKLANFNAKSKKIVEQQFADRSFAQAQQNYLYRLFHDDSGLKRPAAKIELSKRFSLDDQDVRLKRPTLGITSDVDGVMYPEKAVIDAVMDASKAHGIKLTQHQAESFNGMTPDARKARLETTYNNGKKLPPDFNAQLNAVILKKQEKNHFEEGAKNAYSMLAFMAVPIGRTTSSARLQMYTKDTAAKLTPKEGALVLTKAEMAFALENPGKDMPPRALTDQPTPSYSPANKQPLFVSTLTRDDIPNKADRKPSPMPHRTTADHLRAVYDISDVAAVEDSHSGVRSGHEVPGHVIMVDNEPYQNDAARIHAHNKILQQIGVKPIDLKVLAETDTNHTTRLSADIDAYVTVMHAEIEGHSGPNMQRRLSCDTDLKKSQARSPVRFHPRHEPQSKVLELALRKPGQESSIIIAEEPHVRELHNIALHLQNRLASDFSRDNGLHNVRSLPKLADLHKYLDR